MGRGGFPIVRESLGLENVITKGDSYSLEFLSVPLHSGDFVPNAETNQILRINIRLSRSSKEQIPQKTEFYKKELAKYKIPVKIF